MRGWIHTQSGVIVVLKGNNHWVMNRAWGRILATERLTHHRVDHTHDQVVVNKWAK